MRTRRKLLRDAIIGAGGLCCAKFSSAVASASDLQRSALNIRLPLHPEDAAHSPFNRESTAEEVTEGIDLSGKTALLTGSTSGLGLETLRVLVLRGAHVFACGRTLEQAQQACAQVMVKGVPGKATPISCEQTDYDAVVAATNTVSDAGVPIDMLICNAGLNVPTLEQVRGIEKHFVVQHLSHFLLVNRLMRQLKAAPQGRVVMVASIMYQDAPPQGIDFDNLSGEKGDYDWAAMYGQSKLANGLFVRELTRRLAPSSVTANVLHPGLIPTPITDVWKEFRKNEQDKAGQGRGGQDTPDKPRRFAWNREPSPTHPDSDAFRKTIPQGAATQCYVATHPSLRRVSGAYFRDCRIAQPLPSMQDDALAAKLWKVSEELTRPFLLPA